MDYKNAKQMAFDAVFLTSLSENDQADLVAELYEELTCRQKDRFLQLTKNN